MWQEKKLIAQFNRGDPQALRRMYTLYKQDLTTLATALLFNKAQAEDVVHDVFARLMDSNRKISITSNVRGYLFRAVANMARSVNRSEKTLDPDTEAAGADGFPSTVAPAFSAMFQEQRERLIDALPKLPYEQREVLLLRHYGDLRFVAIAGLNGTH